MEGLRQSEDVLWRHEAWCGSHGHGEAVHQRGAYPESGGVILAAAYRQHPIDQLAGLGCVEWWAELGGRVKGSLSWSVEVAVVTDVAVIWRSRNPEESEQSGGLPPT